MVLEAFGQALQNFAPVGLWVVLGIGVISGLIFGIIPGLGGIMGLALFLPFAFYLAPERALPLMVALVTVVNTGGAMTAILLNIPGTEPNAATLIDGFPMTQKGETGRALGAALASSGLSGLVTALIALAMIPLVLLIIMGITSVEMVFIVLVGISFIAVLSAGSMSKGMISGGLGLLISFVGFQSLTGVSRFTFGNIYLYDGLHLVPAALGLFGLPEAIVLAVKGGAIARTGVVIGGMEKVWEGVRDVFRHWALWLRSSLIGYIVGIIPGVGGTVGCFIAYGQAKQTSRHPEKFGTGCVEGVIAPESANNASQVGALLTTLALGIPGSASGAVLLGGLLMVGLIPGPDMLNIHLDLSLTLLLVAIIANLLAAGICLFAGRQLARVATVPGRLLSPLILTIIFVSVFAIHEEFLDVVVALVFAVLGLSMRQLGYNRPALILGFILGFFFERYFFISLQIGGPLFFMRPISLILIVIIIGVIAMDPIRGLIRRKRGVTKA